MSWDVQCFGSGTMIVSPDDRGPWLYVYGPRNDDDDRCQRDRFKVCEDLCAFLNGGPRPAWLNDMRRTSI